MTIAPPESRAIYRAAERWGLAGIKWKAKDGRWVGAGAVDNPLVPTFIQETRIRVLLKMETEHYERWKR